MRTEINLKDVLLTYISWYDYNKIADFIKNKANDKKERAEKLHDYFVAMRIRRNFKSEKDYPKIMENVIDVLDDSNGLVNETADSLNEKLQKFYSDSKKKKCNKEDCDKKDSSKKDQKNCMVACSKILWLYNHDNIIMDSINQKTLKKLINRKKSYNNEYGIFCEDWEAEFDKRKDSIQKLTDTFKKTLAAAGLKTDVLDDKTFQQRVFDAFLINADRDYLLL